MQHATALPSRALQSKRRRPAHTLSCCPPATRLLQPSPETYELFDDVMLLASGMVRRTLSSSRSRRGGGKGQGTPVPRAIRQSTHSARRHVTPLLCAPPPPLGCRCCTTAPARASCPSSAPTWALTAPRARGWPTSCRRWRCRRTSRQGAGRGRVPRGSAVHERGLQGNLEGGPWRGALGIRACAPDVALRIWAGTRVQEPPPPGARHPRVGTTPSRLQGCPPLLTPTASAAEVLGGQHPPLQVRHRPGHPLHLLGERGGGGAARPAGGTPRHRGPGR